MVESRFVMTSVPRVHRLPVRLANQIAAGEVVERPASVLKELLENSLDAGASTIRVDVEGGGIRLIRVQDNGSGIYRDDMVLALSRHATSKIDKLADLEHLSSMGFRGEALASITSVSRFRVISRTAEMETGCCIEVAGSELQGNPFPLAHPPGTTVEVRDLFFNTPARRHFLRSERTEQGHLEDVFKRVALSRFDIAFSLNSGQRKIHKLQAAQELRGQERRVMKLCGKAFLDHALHLEFDAAGMRLHGWLGTPDFARSQTDLQYFFINSRTIRDKLVNHAIRQAYQERLYPGRHPAYVLFLEMAPEQVDVNVHPAKHEVRFREARLVHDFLVSSLQRALDDGADVPPGKQSGSDTASFAGPSRQGAPGRAQVSVPPSRTAPEVKEQIAAYKKLHEPARLEPAEMACGSPGTALAELYGRYLLARKGEQLLLIDIVAARECLFQERLTVSADTGTVSAQPLLLPVRLELDKKQYRAAEQYHEQLQKLGIDISPASPEQMIVRQLPRLLRDCDASVFIPALLTELGENPAGDRPLSGVIARHAARAVTRALPLTELTGLLYEIEPLVQREAGKRICVELEQAVLERLFHSI